MCIDLEPFFTFSFKTYARTSIPLEVGERKNVMAELYHLNVENQIFRDFAIVHDPQMSGKGKVGELILV